MTDPVEPEPTEPKPATFFEQVDALKRVLQAANATDVPTTPRTVTNITRQSRRIE